MKRFIYQFHSWLGLVAGLGLLVIGLTGSALVFKQELDRLLAPRIVMAPDPAKPRLAPDALLSAAQSHLPDRVIQGWGRALEPDLADAVYAVKPGEAEGRMIRIDPATGTPTADPETHRTFTDWLLEIHFSFLGGHTGTFIVGLFGVLLLLLGVSGVWLYRGFWKTLFRLRLRKSARLFFSDFHKMTGITSTVFNLVLGFTGAWWNITHIVGHWMEPEPPAPPAIVKWTGTPALAPLLAEAAAQAPGYQANWINVPTNAGADVMFFGAIEGQSSLRSPYGATATFDGATGAYKSIIRPSDGNAWTQILDAFRPVHFGTFGGLPVKILWSLGGLTPAALALSGTLMWWKRKFPKGRVISPK